MIHSKSKKVLLYSILVSAATLYAADTTRLGDKAAATQSHSPTKATADKHQAATKFQALRRGHEQWRAYQMLRHRKEYGAISDRVNELLPQQSNDLLTMKAAHAAQSPSLALQKSAQQAMARLAELQELKRQQEELEQLPPAVQRLNAAAERYKQRSKASKFSRRSSEAMAHKFSLSSSQPTANTAPCSPSWYTTPIGIVSLVASGTLLAGGITALVQYYRNKKKLRPVILDR